ncbi:uncharacterized protein [Fopius arisanus]|uniref:Uncharacterized protein n=1 Tax=Fopius arisanus TaxID=64838 RepID=A0A9R1UAX4_9HYME|nr:PREDICTED: uncharacterized protein LOC105273039 [Fopius arisanus]
MSLANGNIADGCYRLAVLIRGFKPMPELTKGAYATFHGRIENSKPGSALLSVDDMTKVTVDGSKKKLTVEQLRLAIRQPSTKSTSTTAKRPGDDDKENADGNKDSEKKMKTD